MRLAEIMSSPVETITAGARVTAARAQMDRLRIHHLAVLDGKRVVGVLSAHDLAAAGDGETVEERMATDVVSAEPDTTLREAANKLRGRAVGCLPIIDGGKLVGMVTIADLLELVGKGVERPVEQGKRWTLKHRGPRDNARSRRGS